VAELEQRFPLGEVPADEDVAEAAAFLCSDRARMITGQALLVNAGELLR
jgi:enoyl-[acyl-carrier-protein] reductase (NADH)